MKQRIQESGEERALLLHKGEQTASWFSAFKHSWHTVLKIDRSKLTLVPAIRNWRDTGAAHLRALAHVGAFAGDAKYCAAH